ncbi:MAG: hypothetical protein ACYCZB_02305 [Acidiphilium sp.]
MTVQTKPAIVTTGSVAGSRKIYRKFYSSPPDRPDIVGPFLAVDLHPSSRHAPFRLYDPSGPFTESGFMLDLDGGLPQLRGPKFAQRGFKTMDARAVKPEDNDFAAADKLVPPCPATRTRLTRRDGPPVTQYEYACADITHRRDDLRRPPEESRPDSGGQGGRRAPGGWRVGGRDGAEEHRVPRGRLPDLRGRSGSGVIR